MAVVIIIVGVLLFFIGVIFATSPESIFGYLRSHYDKLVIHVLAVVVRLSRPHLLAPC